ncbi:MAG: Lrp/AsnC family transcriptional regulator [Pseudomonadota bacterium]
MPHPGKTDRLILNALQKNGRTTLSEISHKVHLSSSQVQRRIRHLEETGVIEQYTALVDRERLGFTVVVFAEVTLHYQGKKSAEQFHNAVQNVPEILELHRISGDSDYLLKIIAKDLQQYSVFAQDKLMALPNVERLRSLIVMDSPKTSTQIPC